MLLDRAQLATLVAVLREGTFEKAAQQLHVTPSAVSQRIRQLEELVGGIVVVRGAQTRATALGESLYRHGLQLDLLERELDVVLGGESSDSATRLPPIGIAVNADSLATWLSPALATFAHAAGAPIEVIVDDQDHTTDWLRSGRVLGAITTDARAVQGCRVAPLGTMLYRANAAPGFVRQFLREGVSGAALSRAPVVAFNRKDSLHQQFLGSFGFAKPVAATHFLPSPFAILDACLTGAGWGMNPDPLVAKHVARKRLLDLAPSRPLRVQLHWQCWSLASKTLTALTEALLKHAAVSLAKG